MRLSARNQLTGTVVSIVRGPVNAMVKIDLGNGNTVSATLTADGVDTLGLAEGDTATAIFKATAVIVGVEE